MIRVLHVCRLLAASSAWSRWEHAASSLQAPSRIRISWSIFLWMSLSCNRGGGWRERYRGRERCRGRERYRGEGEI
jgi:hypothetical protein